MRTRMTVAALALALGVGLFVGAPSRTASAWYGGQVHCVQYGETLSGIAANYGTSVWAIANANGLSNPNWIRAGMCLTIPSGGGYYGGGYTATPYYGGYTAKPYYGGYNNYNYNYNYGKSYYGGYYGSYYNYWNQPYYGGYYGKKY